MNVVNTHHMIRVMRKPVLSLCENKDVDQLRGTAQLIGPFVFASLRVQSLYFLNLKFQTSSHILWFLSDLVGNP